jgi:aryl-alcohol dehydrogenase-like predicted oxidoreductase
MLEKLDRIARDRNTSVSAITLAWLRQQKTVATPIASATKLEQIKELMPVIALSGSDLQELTNS